MKDLKELAGNFNATTVKNFKEDGVVIDQFAKTIINKVFDQLSVIFPAWKHAWPTEKELSAAKMEWTKAFNENGINTIDQVKFGFVKARRSESDFLPSCGKFISWCRPTAEDLGYPSEHRALKACLHHRRMKDMFDQGHIKMTTRPFIIELCKYVDWWLIDNAGSKAEQAKADKHFKEEYMALIESGYQEPKETTHKRLETKEVVRERMTPEQEEDERKRGLECLKRMKEELAKAKEDKLIK
jgi:hypothetical protein